MHRMHNKQLYGQFGKLLVRKSCLHIYTTGKKYGIFFISAIYFNFCGVCRCFCIWNTFLRASRYYFWVRFFRTRQQNKAHKFKNIYVGTFFCSRHWLQGMLFHCKAASIYVRVLITGLCAISLGKFNWGVRYVIIFQYVQFSIRLAAVSYSGKKVRSVVSPLVRSVNKSRDTRNCVKTSQNMRYVSSWPLIHITRIMSCALIWPIRQNYNQLGDGQCDATGHRKMLALGTAGAIMTTHEISVMMWSFTGPELFSIL